MAGLAYAGAAQRLGVRQRHARRRAATAACSKSRQLVGVRGAGLPFDGLYYVKSVTHDIKRGEYKQSFAARAQRADLDRADGAGMSAGPFYGKYRGTVINNVDPLQIGRIQAIVPDVGGLDPEQLGDAVPAGRRHQHGHVHRAADRLRRLDRVRARRPRLSDLGRRLLGQRRRGAGARARRCRPGVAGITLQTTLKNGIVISDVPGPTGGILIQTDDRRDDLGQRRRHHRSRTARARSINMTGPTVDINLGALTVI